jgi:hypothetical protein
MYDDGAGGAPAPAGVGMPKINLEGLIPLILLVVIGIASLNYFNVIDIPYLPQDSSHVQVLFLGQPSLGERTVLDSLDYTLTYRIRDPRSFGNAASEELSQYDIIILDQSELDKGISVSFGEAVQTYVQKGGKLIVVLNSGIYQSVGLGNAKAIDAVGWKANFDDLVPAECVLGPDNVPTCKEGREVTVIGRIRREDFDHEIMQGIEMTPSADIPPYTLPKVLDIRASEGAHRIAYIQSETTGQTFPAILEKKSFLAGKVIYFNYDPGFTPNIFTRTINYLK